MRNLLIALPLAALAACGHATAQGDGPDVTRDFAAGAFDAVALQGSDDVRVVRGPVQSIVASGPASVLDRLDIRVEGSTLKIGRKRDSGWTIGWGEHRGATVTVTVPAIRAAAVGGSGDMIVDHADGDGFEASVGGSGSLTLAAVSVKQARFGVAGSGNLVAVGRAGQAKLDLAGSGDIDADRLESDHAAVSIAGSGNARVTARQSAEISIVGSGDATVTGTDNCKVSKLGSGDVKCVKS